MNGKYMGWREQRWVDRDLRRLERMRERRDRKDKKAALAQSAPEKGEPKEK